MENPRELTPVILAELHQLPQDSPVRRVLEAALEGHHRNQRRRAAVLKHEDLRKRLTRPPLSFTRPTRWNGYIPPAMVKTGEPELLRSARVIQDGALSLRYNQMSRYTQGEIPNDSAQRAALVEISAEAWRREQASADQAAE